MRHHTRKSRFPARLGRTICGPALALCLGLIATPPATAQGTAADVYGSSARPILVGEYFLNGLDNWRTQRLDGRSTEYRIVDLDGNPALKAASDNAAAALIRRVSIGPLSGARLRWRWRVLDSVIDDASEREKNGDDYAARLLVLFGDASLSSDTRALAYAWAGNEPIGARFPNPFTASVMTYVLQSGDDRARAWVDQERDVFADYLEAFGELPETVAGIAIVVDTDNTGFKTMAWFDDIELLGTPR